MRSSVLLDRSVGQAEAEHVDARPRSGPPSTAGSSEAGPTVATIFVRRATAPDGTGPLGSLGDLDPDFMQLTKAAESAGGAASRTRTDAFRKNQQRRRTQSSWTRTADAFRKESTTQAEQPRGHVRRRSAKVSKTPVHERRAIPGRGRAHPAVRPGHRRPNPRTTARPRATTSCRRRRRSCRRAPSSTRTTSCGRSRASRGSAPGNDPARRRQRLPPRGGGGGGGGGGGPARRAALRVPPPLRAGDVLIGHRGARARRGRRRAAGAASCCSPRTSPSTANQNGELVVTARGVGVRTERSWSSDDADDGRR